ncbi:MAG: hypothetical protein CMJ78_07705 [Planctomycetaceae bacterium]|nr:hypothetical protein [Planctomycetaceae bacterium]
MDADYILIGSIAIGIVILVWASWPRSRKTRATLAISASYTTMSGFTRHDFYGNITLDALAVDLPSDLFDAIQIDSELGDYVIAVVSDENWFGPAEFKTQFTTSNGDSITKTWCPAKHKVIGEAIALFILPSTVIAGTTEIHTST